MTIVTEAPQSNPLIVSLAALLGDAIVLTLDRPDVIEALRKAFTVTAAADISQAGPWTKKQYAARHKLSSPTIDRLVREGLPYSWAGTHKRFDAASDAWMKEARRAPKKSASEDRVDVSSIAKRGGLRLAVGGK